MQFLRKNLLECNKVTNLPRLLKTPIYGENLSQNIYIISFMDFVENLLLSIDVINNLNADSPYFFNLFNTLFNCLTFFSIKIFFLSPGYLINSASKA
jgi:hypothetical protein